MILPRYGVKWDDGPITWYHTARTAYRRLQEIRTQSPDDAVFVYDRRANGQPRMIFRYQLQESADLERTA